jgi:hypothetical protein
VLPTGGKVRQLPYKVQEQVGLIVNGTYQLLADDDANILADNVATINTNKKKP